MSATPGSRPPEAVAMTIPIVTVSEITLPRWMTPFAKQLFSIPTHMTGNERLTLMQVALALGSGFTVLEIGSYLGASTAFLGFAALRGDGVIHAVDPWTNDAMGSEGERDTFGEFRRNTQPFEHYIVPHVGFSADVHAREAPIACDMLFIDGDHRYEAVAADLRMWLPSLKPGGVLAMHDVDQDGVRRAFEEVAVGGGRVNAAEAKVTDRLLVVRTAALV